MVRLHNATQNVDNFLCENAGLSIPDTVEKCGGQECPHWVMGEWTLCLQSRCLTRNKAVQSRNVICKFTNGTDTNACDESEKPLTRQTCFNERCKPIWRLGEWSEVKINIHLNHIFIQNSRLPFPFHFKIFLQNSYKTE